MIARVYVDNFKCFSNFEYKPAANELILGRNGTGKSSLFDVLRLVRELIHEGRSVLETDRLGPHTLNRAERRNAQQFELSVAGNGGVYWYDLTVEYERDHDGEARKWRVGKEELRFRSDEGDQDLLFRRYRDEGHLFRDGGSPGPQVVMDWNRSGLYGIQPRSDNTKLSWFKKRIAVAYCVQVLPQTMRSETREGHEAPSATLDNFADWYFRLRLEDDNLRDILKQYMAEAIDGFSALQFKPVGERTHRLDIEIAFPDRPSERYSLAELSDGQRALLALYTLLAVLERSRRMSTHPVTLCVDEPENFVALSELQPWIHALEEVADGEHAQVLIASHHPEFINHYAHTSATLFYRDEGGPVRTKPFTGEGEGGLLPAEIVARGWEDE